jgi:GNAT superfamily N-acetyltransferase
MSPYEIRLARPEEVLGLPEIERAACVLFEAIPGIADLPLYLTPPADFVAAQRQGLLWVAALPGAAPVGFALVERVDGCAYLQELDVLPDHGRRGLGTALIRAVREQARRSGLPAVTLTTFRDVPWNAPFYRRLGFRDLAPAELTPGLAAIVEAEEAAGLPRPLRVALRLDL